MSNYNNSNHGPTPFDPLRKIPTIVQSMQEMKWVPFGDAMGREEWLKAEKKAYNDLVESTTAR
jgi:hypothetical protein